jgi:signal transduction histidine kinase
MVPKKIIVLVIASVIIIIVISSVIYFNIIQFLNSNRWAAQTYQIVNQLEVVHSDINDIENDTRGYIITGNEIYHNSYNDASIILATDLSTLRNFITIDNSPLKPLDDLEKLIRDKLKIQEEQFNYRKSGSFNPSIALITEEVGISKMIEIRNAISAMTVAENNLLADRIKERAIRTFGLFAVIAIMTLVLIGTIIATILLFRKELGSKRKVHDRLQEDITARKRAEEQLKLTLIDLENSQLESKKYAKELEEINETKDKLFSIIAHDLRSPFQVLKSASEILINDLDSFNKEDIQQIAGELRTTVNNQRDVVDNLLTWVQLQRGKIEANPRRIFLYDKVKIVTEQLKMHIENKNISIFNNVPNDTVVTGDMDMLQIVISNLIYNAIKYSNPGGVIEINTIKSDGKITTWVSDNGTGMDSDVQKLIFSIDSKMKRHGTHDEKGTGLGLNLSKEMMERQGGKIWFKSEPGKGSTFYFSLPEGMTES